MFEKDAEEYAKGIERKASKEIVHLAFKDGAEFGYNKANEWHEIESKVSPKREISKQYMPKNKEKVLLKYHFSGEKEIHFSDGYYDAYDFEFHIANNPKYRIVCVIAWKEIKEQQNDKRKERRNEKQNKYGT